MLILRMIQMYKIYINLWYLRVVGKAAGKYFEQGGGWKIKWGGGGGGGGSRDEWCETMIQKRNFCY